jgi:hypothetical protein
MSTQIRIIPTTQEVKYNGLFFPISKIKPYVGGFVKQDYLDRFIIHRAFNPKTGNIDYKFAWDSILHELHKDGFLGLILELILSDEEAE